MYSVIIADDSKKICEGLQEIVSTCRPDLEIIGVYYNGKSLIEALSNKLPDILITDIRMPGADGIEVCEYLKSRNADTQVILITAFQEFEYAKKAIDHKVSAFLIKPYSSSQLFEALDNSVKQLEEKLNYVDAITDLYFKNREETIKNIFEIYSKSASPTIIENALLLNQSTPAKNCFVMEADIVPTSAKDDFDFDFDSPHLSCFTVDENHLVLFFKEIAFADAYFNDCLKEAKFSGEDLSILKSQPMSYNEWKKYCEVRNTANLISYAIKEMRIKALLDSSAFLTEIEDKPLENIFKLANKTLNINLPYDYDVDFKSNIFKLNEFYLNETPARNISQRVTNYILLNFENSSLSVSKIAEHLSLNSDYISNFFKKETGKTITEFVTQTRISKAVELLKSSDMTIHQVALAVGFNDISYFNRVFKKHNSITPTQFQKRRGKYD